MSNKKQQGGGAGLLFSTYIAKKAMEQNLLNPLSGVANDTPDTGLGPEFHDFMDKEFTGGAGISIPTPSFAESMSPSKADIGHSQDFETSFLKGSLPDRVIRGTRAIAPAAKVALGVGQNVGENIAEFATGQNVGAPAVDFRKPSTASAAQPSPVAPQQTAPALTPQAPATDMTPVTPGSPQANFLIHQSSGKAMTPEQLSQANTLAQSMGTTFSPETGYDRQPFINAQSTPTPTPSGLTTAGGAPLGEFLSGAAMPEYGLPQAERQLAGRGETLSPEAFGRLSDEREQRMEERIAQNGSLESRAISDRERRGTGEMSMEAATRLAGGDRDKARAMIEAQRQGAGSEDDGALTFDQQLKLAQFEYKKSQDAITNAATEQERSDAAEQQFTADTEKYQVISSDASRIGRLVGEAIGLTTESGTTGLSGTILKHLPGTNANQLKEVLAVVQSKVALDRLAQVKSTGATLGQVSNVELEMLQKSFDALQQNLKGERLRKALTNYATQLNDIESKIESQYKAKYKGRLGGTQADSQQSATMQSGDTTPSGRKVKIY